MLKINDYDFSLLEKQNEFYEYVFSFVDDVKRIIKKYDGKFPSKRIETELKAINKGFWYSADSKTNRSFLTRYWSIKLYCPQEKSGVKIGDYWYRIKDDCFYFVDYEKVEEKIDANAIIEKLDKHIQSIKDSIEEQKQARKNLKKLVDNFNKYGQAFEDAKNALSCLNYVKETKEVYFF